MRIAPADENRGSLIIQNLDTVLYLYIGGDIQVSVNNGLRLGPGAQLSLNVGLGDDPTTAFWGIASGVSIDVRWMPQSIKEFLRALIPKV